MVKAGPRSPRICEKDRAVKTGLGKPEGMGGKSIANGFNGNLEDPGSQGGRDEAMTAAGSRGKNRFDEENGNRASHGQDQGGQVDGAGQCGGYGGEARHEALPHGPGWPMNSPTWPELPEEFALLAPFDAQEVLDLAGER
jgi:hypothetical protein